jgi:apolipoprotein N-acyltransferase
MDVGDGANGSSEIYNAAFAFDRSGHRDSTTRYHKRRLVPLVERNPFPFPARRDNELTPGPQGELFSPGTPPFGVLICHEGAFEDLSREYRRDGADFLINISNDSWYAGTNGTHQHGAHVVMRAVENRIGIARAGNGGVSQLVDATGRRHDTLGVGVRAHGTGTLWTSDTRTLYTRLGDWVGMASILSMFGLIGFAGRAAHLSRSQR